MPGPWEDYAPAKVSGPWEDYGGTTRPSDEEILSRPAIPTDVPTADLPEGAQLALRTRQEKAKDFLRENVTGPFSQSWNALTEMIGHPVSTLAKASETVASGIAGKPLQLPQSTRVAVGLEGKAPLAIPSVHPDQIGGPDTFSKVSAGVLNAGIDFANFFLTPDGVAVLGIGGLPAGVQKAAAVTFGATMATQAPQQLNAAIEAAKQGDWEEAAKQATSGISGTVLGATLLKHGITPNGSVKFTEEGQPLMDFEKPTETPLETKATEVGPATAEAVKETVPNEEKSTKEALQNQPGVEGVGEQAALRTSDLPAERAAETAPEPTAEQETVSELTHPILGLTEKQLSLPSLRTLKMRDPVQWANVQKVFGAKTAADIARLAKARFEQMRQAEKPKGESTASARTQPERPWDIIDEFEAQVGGKISLSKAKDLIEDFKPVGAARDFFAKDGIAPDVAAQASSTGKDISDVDFLESINAAAKARIANRAGSTAERKALSAEQQLNASREPIAKDELAIGDKFTVKGHQHEVTGIDPDTDRITTNGPLETMRGTGELWIDKGSLVKAPEQAEGALPKLRQMENQGDLLATQTEDFALTGEKDVDYERVQREKAAALQARKEAEEIQRKQQLTLSGRGIAASAREKLQQPNEEAFIHVGPVFTALAKKRDLLGRQLAGESAPKTSHASEESGNKLVRYASAKIAAPEIAKYLTTEVLGDHYKDRAFSQKLGAVLVEDRLRAIKQSFQQANNPAAASVTSIIGKTWSPFATEAEYQAAIANPEIQAAIQRHRASIQPTAQLFHEQAGGQLAGPGLQTGAFVNLKATALIDPIGGASRGNLQNPLRRPSRFSKQAKGSAEQYELDYRTLAERMVSSNFEEYAKRQWYDQMVSDGLAQINDPGDPIPEINGKPAIRFTIERKGTPMGLTPTGQARARTYVKYLDVRSDLAGEVRQALNTDGKIGNAAIVQAANIINHIQLAGPTDAVWHTANMIASIAESQGGRTVLRDLARKLPGVNLADAVTRVVASSIKVLRDTPEIQQQLAEIADIGALRSQAELSKFNVTGKFIRLADKAGRLVRNQMYQNLVDRGLVPDTEAGRREWINQMGNYNSRLMSQFQRFFKEAGFSPFVVAGRNFNRMAWRQLTLSPGVQAVSLKAAAEMRAVNAFGILATLVVIPSLINYFTVGTPNGRPGTKFGQIDTGKDHDGKHIVIDPAQWTGLRRGLRISGAQAIIEGVRRDQPMSENRRNAIRDQLGGIIHPWAGPAVKAPVIAATGYSPTLYKESINPNDYGENAKAALKQLNSVAERIMANEKGGTAISRTALSLGGAVGVKEVPPYSTSQDIHAIARDYAEKSTDKRLHHEWEQRQKEHFESDYNDLRTALRSSDLAKAKTEYDKLMDIGKKRIHVIEVMRPNQPIISRRDDVKFLQSLTPQQKAIYEKAKQERTELWQRFQKMLRQ